MEAGEALRHLVRVDRDAILVYSQAIEVMEDPLVRSTLMRFRDDHRRHVDSLSAALRRIGIEVPEQPHAAALGLAGFTAISAEMGLIGGLVAMEANEVVTNRAYDLAVTADLPEDIRNMVAANRRDERRHLERIREMVQESAGASAPILDRFARAEGRMASGIVNTSWPVMLSLAAIAAGAVWLVQSRRRQPGRRSHASH